MRRILFVALLPALLGAAPALQIVRPIISQMDGGASDPPGTVHVPGETLYFSCRIAGYTKNPDEQIHLAYSVQPFDSQGAPLSEIYQNEMTEEVGPHDKGWMPKIATQVAIPPLVATGIYKIVVKAEDLIGKTSAEVTVPFQVRGHEVPPSDCVVVRNFRFFRREDDTAPAEKAAFKPGDGVWARFDIAGFKYGPKNKIDVSYVTSVLAPGGKLLWTQPNPVAEQTESFYPKRYVPADFGISLQPNMHTGEYTIVVHVKDTIGGKEFEGKYPFRVE